MDYILMGGVLAVVIYTLQRLRKRFNQGCCDPGDQSEEIVKVKKLSYPYHVDLEIEGMHCEQCQLKVTKRLNREVDYYGQARDLRHVDLYADQAIDADKVATLIQEVGYRLVEVREIV